MKWIEWKAVAPKLTWINLMTYDYHGPWGDADTDFLSPLNGDPKDPEYSSKFWDIAALPCCTARTRCRCERFCWASPCMALDTLG